MCGIFCSLSRLEPLWPSEKLRTLLQARGPDAVNQLCESSFACEGGAPETHMTFVSTVLSLRGSSTTVQPYQSGSQEPILCWNGEAWSVCGEPVVQNDTASVYGILCRYARMMDDFSARPATDGLPLASAISSIAGPFAFVFYDRLASRIYFGRDFLGRRSLLYHITGSGDVILSSVADDSLSTEWSEVENDGVYCIDLSMTLLDTSQPQEPAEIRGHFVISKSKYDYLKGYDTDSLSAIPGLSLNRFIPPNILGLTAESPSVRRLEDLLRASVLLRVQGIPDPPQRDPYDDSPHGAKLGILFSGGLDCTVLAKLSHETLPISQPFDLLNVAFENPRVHKTLDGRGFELCPDRITGRASHAELCRTCPGRHWRFVAINVPYVETQAHRRDILSLMHPHNTEMDLSIACALYFAARGSGVVSPRSGSDDMPFTTSARVLLSGLGADELFAGYTRHANAFTRRGFDGLLDELELDLGRLGKRNLGRDDRVISHWGREARFPFLDESLLRWAVSAPVADKCDFGTQSDDMAIDEVTSIEHGKKVLRCLAWKLGLKTVAREKKRAVSAYWWSQDGT